MCVSSNDCFESSSAAIDMYQPTPIRSAKCHCWHILLTLVATLGPKQHISCVKVPVSQDSEPWHLEPESILVETGNTKHYIEHSGTSATPVRFGYASVNCNASTGEHDRDVISSLARRVTATDSGATDCRCLAFIHDNGEVHH